MSSKRNQSSQEWSRHNSGLDTGVEDLTRIWRGTNEYKSTYPVDTENGIALFKSKIENNTRSTSLRYNPGFGQKFIRVAAAILFLVAAFFLIKNGLSLTEKTIITSTEVGVKKVVSLSDGSKITLNENSRISFTSKFNEKDRKVKLIGEGYFEIAKMDNKPFIVETELANITVLGTTFNIRAYTHEESVEIYVNSGSVAVQLKDTQEELILAASDKLLIEKGKNQPGIKKDNNGNSMAWSRGKLFFRNTPFGEVFRSIEKEFGVTIEIKNPEILACPYTQTIELRRRKLKEAFRAIQLACPIIIVEEKPGSFVVSGRCCD